MRPYREGNGVPLRLELTTLLLDKVAFFIGGCIMNVPSYYAVEWSPSQKVFHVDTVGKMISNNINNALKESVGGEFVCIGIFETREQCSTYIEKTAKPALIPEA